MIFTERKVRRQAEGTGSYAHQCETAGCTHSARFDACFLKAYHVRLCSQCKRNYEEAYDNALRGWPDEEARTLAEDYRATA